MKLARAFLASLALAASFGGAVAQTSYPDFSLAPYSARSYAGLKDMSDIPAPIPVPEARPIPESFSYYLRTDIGYGMGNKPSFSEAGRVYGSGGPTNFNTTTPFGFGGSGFSSVSDKTADSFAGGFGFGAYLTPRLRGDVTVEFRGERATDVYGTYSYASTGGAPAVNGSLHDSVRLLSTVGMINGYFDLLPRGGFTPYVGGGVGLVYHQINRSYLSRETRSGVTSDVTGAEGSTRTAFAAAAIAGFTYDIDHRWGIDINYRALYLQGASVTLRTSGLTTNQVTAATVGDNWEHQIRIGLRFNIW
jgi:opacity protein-like surface antigen